MKITPFWPWLTAARMRFEEGGEPTGGNGDSVPEWIGDSDYLSQNPDKAKAFHKYKTRDEQVIGHHEAMKLLGQPYRLPKDPGKLTDEQRADIVAQVAKMQGVPETPEGYDIKVPDGSPIDQQALADWKAYCREAKLPPSVAQGAVDFQLKFVERLNNARNETINTITTQTFNRFVKEDCGGNEGLAGERLEMVKRFLQSQCVDANGNADPELWEAVWKRTAVGDRMIELPMLKALHKAAMAANGTGGAPMGQAATREPTSGLVYPEMRKQR